MKIKSKNPAAPSRLRVSEYSVGGYVASGARVLLLWHSNLARWVPAGGRIDFRAGEYPHEAVLREVREECGLEISIRSQPHQTVADSIAIPLPLPAQVQELRLEDGSTYLDFVYYCSTQDPTVELNYREARAYHWFTAEDLDRFPLLDHVRGHSLKAMSLPNQSQQVTPKAIQRLPVDRPPRDANADHEHQ